MTTGPTRLVLLGHPVGHSLSPPLQNAALRSAGLPQRYEALDVPPSQLSRVLAGLRAERAGGNVTVPHKEAVADACDRLTPLAQRIGAVNTFWIDDRMLVGDNTDAPAFETVARELCGGLPSNARVLLLGAGGAARAVVAACSAWPGVAITIAARTRSRAEKLAASFPHTAAVASPEEALHRTTLLVNATPVGMRSDDMPVDSALIPDRCTVIDLVYRPGLTPWVRAVQARGVRAVDGLAILVEQGALAFERWFGIVPDRDAMRAAVG